MRCLCIRIAILIANHSVRADRDFGHIFGYQVTQFSRVVTFVGFILLNGMNDLIGISITYVDIQHKYPDDERACTQVDQAFKRIEF